MLHALLETTFNVHARVGRGAMLLDRRRPGWADEIDVKKLDMADPWVCPLGQIWDHYGFGLMAIGLPNNHAACQHGFVGRLIGSFVPPLARAENACLRAAWVAAIRERTEPERPRAQSLLRQCGTDGASLATVASGTPLHCLVE